METRRRISEKEIIVRNILADEIVTRVFIGKTSRLSIKPWKSIRNEKRLCDIRFFQEDNGIPLFLENFLLTLSETQLTLLVGEDKVVAVDSSRIRLNDSNDT